MFQRWFLEPARVCAVFGGMWHEYRNHDLEARVNLWWYGVWNDGTNL
jgi:hypothetical protein